MNKKLISLCNQFYVVTRKDILENLQDELRTSQCSERKVVENLLTESFPYWKNEEMENSSDVEASLKELNEYEIKFTNLLNELDNNSIHDEKIKSICKQWEIDFKGDLFENLEDILEVHGTIKKYIGYLINECFPIWIEESDKENTELYKEYQARFKNILEVL